MKVRSKPRPCDHLRGFLVVDALQRHGVDLDLEARRLRRVDPLHHLREIAPAGQSPEAVGVQRVERDVDALDPAIAKLRRIAGKLRAIGGDGQFVEASRADVARQRSKQGHDAAAHQRLAAGDANLARAEPHEGGAQPVEFLQRQQILLGQESHVLGHAIDATKVAAIRHRNADVGYGASKGIDERAHLPDLGARRRKRKPPPVMIF